MRPRLFSLRPTPRTRRALLVLAAAAVAGACRQEMYDQPKYKDLRRSDFFADQRQARPLPDGTVARGFLRENSPLDTGRAGGALITEFPLPVDATLLTRGRQRYDIFCAPCHDRTGGGQGMVVRRGYRPPPSFHIERLRAAPVGHFYDVVTNGFGAMPDYASQIGIEDRWAIVAYVRALQLSQHVAAADLPPAERALLENEPVVPQAPAPTPAPAPFPIRGAAPETR